MTLKAKTWLKNSLDLIFTLSMLGASQIETKNVWFPVCMFIAVLSGVSLFAIKKESNEEIKINTFFLFFKPVVISIFSMLLFKKAFDKNSLMTALNTIPILGMYLLVRNPFFTLYNRIGNWAIIDNVVPLIVLLILTLVHINIIFQVILTFISWIILVNLTWNLKKSQ